MGKEEARLALKQAGKVLRRFERKLVSFRAPNLQFPNDYLGLLEDEGFRYDSSIAAYKPPFTRREETKGKIVRIPATITSSVIRLPPGFFLPLLKCSKAPVIFVHPWEFVDMSKMPIRPDCKFNTGEKALKNLRVLIQTLKAQNYRFLTLQERAGVGKGPIT
jgi:peptidoglycan/xylan/chitin deacetylase (PgdA/CDA1 family)